MNRTSPTSTRHRVNGFLVCERRGVWRGLDPSLHRQMERDPEGEGSRQAREILDAYVSNLPWYIPIVDSPDDAHALLRLALPKAPGAEIRAYRSPWLCASGMASFEIVGEFLGYDAVAVGDWSLLEELERNKISPEVPLNRNGLLSAPEDVRFVTQRYLKLQARGRVEEIAPIEELGVDAVEMYLLASSQRPDDVHLE